MTTYVIAGTAYNTLSHSFDSLAEAEMALTDMISEDEFAASIDPLHICAAFKIFDLDD